MGTGESLSDSEKVRRLQTVLHAKAKEAPGFRFYSLSDKVWRADVMAVAWQDVRRNGGAAGVDGQTVADIEAYGVDRWLGELAQHALKRLLQWRCRKHKAETRNPVRLGYERLWTRHGLIRLGPRTTRFPWAKA